MRAPRVAVAAGLLVATTVLGACHAATPTAVPEPGACAPLTARVSTQAPAPAPAGTGTAASARPAAQPLPDVALACVDGSRTVHMGQLRGPALVNLWASWCDPCRAELPAFQRFAERAAGRVVVVGVNTTDTHAGRRSIVEDFGLTFPTLVDEHGTLRSALGLTSLPVTVLVDAAGRIAYVYNSVALDDAGLARLVEQHLGVVVSV